MSLKGRNRMKAGKACRNICVLGINLIAYCLNETRGKLTTKIVRTKLGEVEKEDGIIALDKTNIKIGD